jgi:PPOX class F420-dependent enzyme/OxyR family protein
MRLSHQPLGLLKEGIMSVFTPEEIEYLSSQRLARIATVGINGQPHVVPVGFRYNPNTDTIDIGGHNFTQRKKWRDVQKNPHVAVVIDDVASFQPWLVRGIEIRGEAEVLMAGGDAVVPGFDPAMFRIFPKYIVSWGITPTADTWNTTGRSVGNS